MTTTPNPYAVELALAVELAKVTDRHEAALVQAWGRAWSEVSRDLYDALLDVLTAGGRVNAAAVVRFDRLSSTLAVIADHLDELATGLGVTVTGDLRHVLTLADQSTEQLIRAQLLDPTGLRILSAPPAALDAIVRRTTQQITSQAQPLADDTYAVILRELTRGVAAGDNPRETAARMVQRSEDLHNFGLTRAENIARTETLDAYRDAAQVSQNTNADVLAGWVWLCHLGPRTCRSCLAQHGSFHELDEPGPFDHQSGRCSRSPVVKEPDGGHDLSWVPSAEDHFASLSVEDQQAILGLAGYQAWRAGDFPIGDWSQKRTNPGWRDSYAPAPAPKRRRAVVTGS